MKSSYITSCFVSFNCGFLQINEKIEGATKNRQSKKIGNIGHKTKKTQKAKKMSNRTNQTMLLIVNSSRVKVLLVIEEIEK